jgi:hypothetical protein
MERDVEYTCGYPLCTKSKFDMSDLNGGAAEARDSGCGNSVRPALAKAARVILQKTREYKNGPCEVGA